jgi:hypothetical protein
MGAKGDKGKGKATNPGKVIGTDQNHDRKNVLTKPKKSVLSHPILIMSLLTLDETTLFYYFLSDSKNKYSDFSTGINNWAATVPRNSKPASKVASAAGSRSIASGPPLTDATTRSSGTSALSKNIKVSRDIPIKVESHDTFIQVSEGGLEDDDETAGLEREAAIKSPPKGKKRVSSSVSFNTVSILQFIYFYRRWLKNRRPRWLVHLSGQRSPATMIYRLRLIKSCGVRSLFQPICSGLQRNLIPGTFLSS